MVDREQRFFEVKADGQWRITVEPLYLDPVAAGGMSGTGDAVSGLFTPPTREPLPLVLSHNGESNFILHVECDGGTDYIANEIGSVQIEAVVEFAAGPCFWDVEADGAWSFRPK